MCVGAGLCDRDNQPTNSQAKNVDFKRLLKLHSSVLVEKMLCWGQKPAVNFSRMSECCRDMFTLRDVATQGGFLALSLRCGQGRNEGGKGSTIPLAPNHCSGRRKVPTMSQILPAIKYACFRKTSDSNMGALDLLHVPGAIYATGCGSCSSRPIDN